MLLMTCAPVQEARWQDNRLLWAHRTFCQLALPITLPPGARWSREVDENAVLMGLDNALPSDAATPLPSGSVARLLLLQVFSTALRTGAASVEIGPDPATAAERLGVSMTTAQRAELADQVTRLLGAKLRVTEHGKAPIAVFDARKHGTRERAAPWRPVLHLTQRFFVSLQADAVALDRGAVAALARSAPALDAYAWLASIRSQPGRSHSATWSWAELQARFEQDTVTTPGLFKAAFTRSLKKVRLADPTLQFEFQSAGVSITDSDHLPSPEPNRSAPTQPEASTTYTPDAPSPASATSEITQEQLQKVAASSATAVRPGQRSSHQRLVESARPEPDNHARRLPPTVIAPSNRPIRLSSTETGLPLSIWLQRASGRDIATIEVTPGKDYHSGQRSVLIIEPLVMQVVGNLHRSELAQLETWAMSNAEVIQDYWDGAIATASDVFSRITPVGKGR